MGVVKHFAELRVYQTAFQAAMDLYEISKRWPREEQYSLTDQIRRSSRSVCGNIAEAWRKRRYPGHFVNKLTDADGEVAETQNWLRFALACGHLSREDYNRLWAEYEELAGGLVRMMSDSERWCGPANLVREEPEEYTVDD